MPATPSWNWLLGRQTLRTEPGAGRCAVGASTAVDCTGGLSRHEDASRSPIGAESLPDIVKPDGLMLVDCPRKETQESTNRIDFTPKTTPRRTPAQDARRALPFDPLAANSARQAVTAPGLTPDNDQDQPSRVHRSIMIRGATPKRSISAPPQRGYIPVTHEIILPGRAPYNAPR